MSHGHDTIAQTLTLYLVNFTMISPIFMSLVYFRKLEAVDGTLASKVCKYSAVYAEQHGGLRDGVVKYQRRGRCGGGGGGGSMQWHEGRRSQSAELASKAPTQPTKSFPSVKQRPRPDYQRR